MKKSALILLITSAFALQLSGQTGPEFPWEEPGHFDGSDSPTSSTAVTDGNPQSTTAGAASETAIDTAILPPSSIVEEFTEESISAPESSSESSGSSTTTESSKQTASASSQTSSAQIDIDVGIGSSTINGIDVDYYTVRIPYSHKFNDRSTLNISIPVSITSLKDVISNFDSNGNLTLSDAKVYGGGISIGYSHKVFIKADGKPYRWKVSPTAGIFMRESSDLNQGSWVYNMGLSSSFAYRLSDHWVINLGNSFSYSWNSGRKDFPDPLRDEQQVVINGVQLFYLAGRWTYYGYVVDTRFLKDSLIDSFQTYAIGASFKLTQKRSLKASLLYDDGKGYESLRVTIGTSWKF